MVVELLEDLGVVLQILELLLGAGVRVSVFVVLADPLGFCPEDGRCRVDCSPSFSTSRSPFSSVSR